MRRALIRHGLLTAVALVAIAVPVVLGVAVSARQEVTRNAKQVSTTMGDVVVAQLERFDFSTPGTFQRDAVLRDLWPYLHSGSLHRFKLWMVEGGEARIVLSDEQRLEGETYGGDDISAQQAGGAVVVQRVPNDPEHRFEASKRNDLIEVFMGFADSRENAMSLEAYIPVDIEGSIDHALNIQLPLVLGGLLLLAAATMPLTLGAVRRSVRLQDEQVALQQYALAASDAERRDLARRLHDGPIQQLAAANVALWAGEGAPDDHGSRLASLARRAGPLVTDSIRQLRGWAGELFPGGHTGETLPVSIHTLVEQLVPAAVATDIEVEPELRIGEAATALLYRSCRELVRNAVRHGRPDRIAVSIAAAPQQQVRLIVVDDGVGFNPSSEPVDGHIGLRLVEHSVRDAGGRLQIDSAVGRGTTVTVILPA